MEAKTLVINGRLDGLNEYTKACRGNGGWVSGASMKKKNEDIITAAILEQLPRVHFKGRVRVDFKWYEPNSKRDLDNVCFAKKFILDAFVKNQVIEKDSRKFLYDFTDSFFVDKENPRIVVRIEGEKYGL